MARTVDDLRYLYSNLMGEIKARCEVIDVAISMDGVLGLGPRADLCYVQLRMICELVAIAVLAAHGDLPSTRTKRLQTAYEADKILKHLESLHPDFFPIPATREFDIKGRVRGFKATEVDYLTKQDLMKLYWECGGKLHRGTLDTIGPIGKSQVSLDRIAALNEKIRLLLREHLIILSDPKQCLFVQMSKPPTGDVSTLLMSRIVVPADHSDKSKVPKG